MLLTPQYIQQSELDSFGLPSAQDEPKIMAYVVAASVLIDQVCARQNVDGIGSLIWTTYTERLLTPRGRNLVRLSFRPAVGISQTTFNAYAASAAAGFTPANTSLSAYSTQTMSDGVTLSPICAAFGRYGYGRRNEQQVYPDLNYGANILQIASYFGGPPQFTPVAINLTDVDPLTGEVWVPSGLYLSQYTEILMIYNAGFDPLNIPVAIKQACARLIFNFMAAPSTNIQSFSVGNLHHQFTPGLVDSTVEYLLMPFRTVQAF